MYWQRDPDAIQATDHKYGKLLQNMAYNNLSDLQDSEECQNNVHLRVWNAIPSTRPTGFFAFTMQIMR
jgi:RNA polymerase sigma-70 factor (ECF subfamily)